MLYLSLMQLSADLKTMFEKRIHCDLTLRVGGKDIQCHRCILSARSNWFAEKIRQVKTENNATIDVNESDQIIHALLVYIYAADLRTLESMKIPLIDLYKSAEKYKMYRFKELLTRMVKSECPTKTFKFLCHIEINNLEFALVYPRLEGVGLQGTCPCHLQIRLGSVGDSCSLGVIVNRQTTESAGKILIVHLKMQIEDKKRKNITDFVKECLLKEDENSSVSNYTPFHYSFELNDEFSLSGDLTISEVPPSVIFQVRGSHIRNFENELHILSNDMFKIIKANNYCDMNIQVQKYTLKVHACLMYARSLIPIGTFSSLKDFGITDYVVARSFINFIYTGQTMFLGGFMRDIYCSVWKSQLTVAKIKWSNILTGTLSIDNVLGILTDAIRCNDKELISAAWNFAIPFTNDLIKHATWREFICNHPRWATILIQMVNPRKQ